MIADYRDGGLKMLDIIEFNKTGEGVEGVCGRCCKVKIEHKIGEDNGFLTIATLSGNAFLTSICLNLRESWVLLAICLKKMLRALL